MEINLAILADYANVTREGKLNILGIFSVINVQKFPCIHPQMQIVLEWAPISTDSGTQKNVGVQLVDEDGKVMLDIKGNMVLGQFKGYGPFRIPQIIGLNGIMFNKPGNYAFNIFLEKDIVRNIPLALIQIQTNQIGQL